jgi:uncharacterized SAM-dependent methyltransferase
MCCFLVTDMAKEEEILFAAHDDEDGVAAELT